jgi:hypothetical protein
VRLLSKQALLERANRLHQARFLISARDERQNDRANLTVLLPVGGFICTRTHFSDRLLVGPQ